MKFIEIEVKYDASEIRLKEFEIVCRKLRPTHKVFAASYDHYFCSKSKKRVLRYRAGRKPELTTKKKKAKKNSFHRKEVNLPLSRKADLDTVRALAEMLGLKFDFSIFKDSHIYWYKGYDIVYYTVYSDSTKVKTLGRFIEIEMDEKYDWPSFRVAWKQLKKIEKLMRSIGIKASKRLRKNLFEMYSGKLV